MTHVSCAVCVGTTPCFRCQIKQLKLENNQLRQELVKYYEIDAGDLELKYYHKQLIDDHIVQTQKPQEYDFKNNLTNAYFITITFDPSKFGIQPHEQLRKDYILYQLAKLKAIEKFTECYGCFEYHKNGLIHSHLIMITGFPNEVKQILKMKFTDNTRNKIVIQFDKAKYPAATNYINKESTHYYYSYNYKREVSSLGRRSPKQMYTINSLDESLTCLLKRSGEDTAVNWCPSPLDHGLDL